ncbi:hypothetical protein GCM10007387_18580 [Pseudoduganella albidiflava]|uniref:Uncharacterized protein n=1 Tax=Pseudoduganella albidiflava TaxID=321983 RepID=A0AA87XVT1_9BURK|nr:hypothetical protein GCM10007387_18580 [Pseudoduganella albidiflava]
MRGHERACGPGAQRGGRTAPAASPKPTRGRSGRSTATQHDRVASLEEGALFSIGQRDRGWLAALRTSVFRYGRYNQDEGNSWLRTLAADAFCEWPAAARSAARTRHH